MTGTVITHNRRRSRLSTLIDQPGGISTTTALKQAAENLASLETRSLALIDEAITKLAALALPANLDENRQALDRAYSYSSNIIDAAGPFGREDLCMAAANLCDLLDAAPDEEPFDWRIVTVHAQSFRLLITLPDSQREARDQVLNSLKEVLRAKTGSAETA